MACNASNMRTLQLRTAGWGKQNSQVWFEVLKSTRVNCVDFITDRYASYAGAKDGHGDGGYGSPVCTAALQLVSFHTNWLPSQNVLLTAGLRGKTCVKSPLIAIDGPVIYFAMKNWNYSLALKPQKTPEFSHHFASIKICYQFWSWLLYRCKIRAEQDASRLSLVSIRFVACSFCRRCFLSGKLGVRLALTLSSWKLMCILGLKVKHAAIVSRTALNESADFCRKHFVVVSKIFSDKFPAPLYALSGRALHCNFIRHNTKSKVKRVCKLGESTCKWYSNRRPVL